MLGNNSGKAEESHPSSLFTAVSVIACKVAVVGEMPLLSGGTSPLSTRAQMMRRKGKYSQDTLEQVMLLKQLERWCKLIFILIMDIF